jgi:Mn-dependent DtxR family transcriptional regulator
MPGPERTVRRVDVLETMQDRTDLREPWTVNELASMLDCGESTVYNRLRELKTQGKVRTKEVGASARVWWPVEPRLKTVETTGRMTP